MNLGVMYEGRGLLLNACSQYRAAATADPDHPRPFKVRPNQGGDLPKISGGTAIAYKVENARKSPKKP